MKLPDYGFLIPAALLLGLAPFAPEPHLVEKIRWLFTGQPFKPIDLFDLFLHGAFPALLVVKVGRDLSRKVRGEGRETRKTPCGESGQARDRKNPEGRRKDR